MCLLLLTLSILAFAAPAFAQGTLPIPKIDIGITAAKSTEDVSTSLQVLILLTVLSLAPSILIMVTAFTRIVIVLSFVRRALGTQQLPSNQILIGLSLLLTVFVMAPVFAEINEKALTPYFDKKIAARAAFTQATEPLKVFMLKQTREKDLALFVKLARDRKPENEKEIPLHVLIPAFVISELKLSFEMGIILFMPFLVIDMVVASTLMSMGMIMLPPVMISLPFKILVFVMVDGWQLVIRSLVASFR